MNHLTQSQRATLVNLLCDCPSVADGRTRDAIVDQLPDAIRHGIERHAATKVDVTNIVQCCLNYADGVAALVAAVAFFEGDSFPMQALRRWLDANGNVPPHADAVPAPAPIPPAELASLQRNLEQMRANLRLIQERKAEFVLTTDVPLQLIKEERRLQQAIAQLEQRLAVPPPAPPVPLVSAAPPAPNPFGSRGRIDNPAAFFDREELLREIFEELKKGSSLALLGPREIGKSSLLCMVAQQGPQRLGLPADAFIEINMQLIRNDEQFFRMLCRKLKVEFCYGGDLYMAVEGRRYILCLDEIEKMRSDGFSHHARDELRGLADGANAPFTLLIASGTPLEQLFGDEPGQTSPLANICTALPVAAFPPAVARQFLLTRLHPTGVHFSDAEIDDLIRRSAGHPARLQEYAAAHYRTKISGGT